ncbi:3-hydroxyacyl-CoA dehydrogenase [Roseovarius gahaiensis]|uniref:3-hydroxyacyl-CoA dehydrogenase n=1 Tax=Roseovarius gahaiensis TaxID=2716691 RepID=A0A967BBI0_9RHOB|nr:3-hydroxyacyl-CoA dehydrogenase NAD-binding domain-containing protein [Roseovarius gahaiensis]NHQ74910.1 3-hydroxyacyl-CoA dehydrogenase [Roseovarius gahaiensis]
MSATDHKRIVAVIGAGTMGAGIAQVAAAYGHQVLLYDVAPDAARAAKAGLSQRLDSRVARAKMTADEANALLDRIRPVADLADLAGAGLVIEAIVEDLAIKQTVFAELEKTVADDAILATNTSSISVTSIARALAAPERMVGMHFFNPAPVMKLVEVVSGRATAPEVAQAVFDLAGAWGKVAVRAKSTPGFIVNRVARPFYAEALRLFEEQVASPATLDALMTDGGGFRMGPFALMDLIGHDVNYAVSQSVFDAFYQDPRFRPSLAQRELVNAGHLGRKSGRGFYDYAKDTSAPTPQTEPADPDLALPTPIDPMHPCVIDGIHIVPSDGRLARQIAREKGAPVMVLDLLNADAPGQRLGFATSPDVPQDMVARVAATLQGQGIVCTHLPDWPGLVVMRTVGMLANEGFEAVLQGVASESDVDAAMQFGLNYPKGPIAWARDIGLGRVLAVLDNLQGLTGDPRYRASLGLRMAAME